MRKTYKRKNLASKLIGSLLVLVLSIFACSNLLIQANASGSSPSTEYFFDGYSQGMSAEEIHRETLLDGAVDDEPTITVLIPGQNGQAYNWSSEIGERRGAEEKTYIDSNGNERTKDVYYKYNGQKFVYKKDSMIETLRNQAGGADVYFAQGFSEYVKHKIAQICPKTIKKQNMQVVAAIVKKARSSS